MKFNIINLLTLIFATLILNSCQIKLEDFNPNQESEKLTVEGFVSDSIGFHFVRLSKTTNVLSTQPNAPISDALVVVTDNAGLIDTFQYNAPTASFLPSKVWKGIPGNTYKLNVVTGEYSVYATETMESYANFKIDSLKSVFRETATKNRVENFSYRDVFFTGTPYISVGDSVYRVQLFALKEIPSRVNVQTYVFRNKTLFQGSNTFFVNNLLEVPINSFYVMPPPGGGPPQNIHFLKGDTVTILLQGITDACFVYYQGLNSVLSNDGGLFSAPAGNPPTNLSSDKAIGYFKVARIATKSIVVNNIGIVDP